MKNKQIPNETTGNVIIGVGVAAAVILMFVLFHFYPQCFPGMGL